MDWDDVRVFLAVAREGSMRAAGRALGTEAICLLARLGSWSWENDMAEGGAGTAWRRTAMFWGSAASPLLKLELTIDGYDRADKPALNWLLL